MGGSGGGGASGQVDFPEYMKVFHNSWLEEIDYQTDTLKNYSPYSIATAYNPDGDLANSSSALATFNTLVTSYDVFNSWNAAFDSVSAKVGLTAIDVNSQVAAYSGITDDDIETRVLPQFKRGMQNVGASMGSAFVIGEAIIWASRDRDLSKFQADLAIKNAELDIQRKTLISQNTDLILKNIVQEIELWKAFTHYIIEFNRLRIVAKSEETINNIEFDVKDARWAINSYVEASNVLASISGASTSSQTSGGGPSKAMSALGGAISGAAMGASVGGVPGAAVGGVLGAAAGLLAS